MLTHAMSVQVNRHGVLARREFLRQLSAAGLATGTIGFTDALTLKAPDLRKDGLACILLFMTGGPSQFETFDPKPDTTNGGPTKAIDTAVPGIRIAEPWPNVAKAMKDITLIRSMTNKEGAHPRAVYQLHTGYLPAGSIRYPALGSLIAAEKSPAEFDLPHFVAIGGRIVSGIGASYLGMKYAPFLVQNANQMPSNTELPMGVTTNRFQRRLGLLQEVEDEFAASGAADRVRDHQTLIGSAAQMVLSPRLKAFDLSEEKDALRDRYGRSPFGQACLLARRLVESGVTVVEIESNGWDTHQDNFERTKSLAGPTDQGFAALVTDLRERGMLDRTLVVWMGEFGRTPRINPQKGRDHWPRSFSVALAGGGTKGGRVIGATTDDGTSVKDRPVTVPDLFCTLCRSMRINPRKEHIGPLERPIKVVDGGEAVGEVF